MSSKCIYQEVFDKDDEDIFRHFMNGIKRRLFFETLKHVYAFSKYMWAKVTVT